MEIDKKPIIVGKVRFGNKIIFGTPSDNVCDEKVRVCQSNEYSVCIRKADNEKIRISVYVEGHPRYYCDVEKIGIKKTNALGFGVFDHEYYLQKHPVKYQVDSGWIDYIANIIHSYENNYQILNPGFKKKEDSMVYSILESGRNLDVKLTEGRKGRVSRYLDKKIKKESEELITNVRNNMNNMFELLSDLLYQYSEESKKFINLANPFVIADNSCIVFRHSGTLTLYKNENKEVVGIDYDIDKMG